MATLMVRPTEDQQMRWADAARRLNKPVPAFVAWASDFAARYTLEESVQALHRKRDPILARLEEKKRLRVLVDAARYAVEFLPDPFFSPISGDKRDPRGDLQRALESLREYLEEVQEEYRK